MHNQLQHWIYKRQESLCHRQLLLISGEQKWATELAKNHILDLDEKRTLWVGDNHFHSETINVKHYRSKLGHEYNYLIINAFDGFRANAAMALSGTIKSGGLMVILCPRLEEWPNYNDPEHVNRISYGYNKDDFVSHFYAYIGKRLVDDPWVSVLTKEQFVAPICRLNNQETEKSYHQQKLAVAAICKVAKGRNNKPLVITADRGRGKSSALGIAAAQLMQESPTTILITAPHISTTEQVFNHTKALLAGHILEKNRLNFQNSSLIFIALDKLIETSDKADILLIDEAAAIPVEILTRLTERFSRIVFSTTIHGYEGSGQGFELRFKPKLTELKPNYKTIHLSDPIRWHENDPIEKFWFKALCYQPDTGDKINFSNQPIICKHLTKQQLLSTPETFNTIISLLINAHYQTSPDDIQRLLDAPESKCFVITQNNKILGVAQVNEEGGQHLAPLANEIAAGKRRLKGHLVAQNIASHYNSTTFASLTQWRVSRLAIQPNLQGTGLGSQLLSYIKQQAKTYNVSVLTAAYGCHSSLLNFWYKNGFNIIKLSNKVEVSSGENNCMCICALNEQAGNIQTRFLQEFYQELIYQVDKAWQNISADLLGEILATHEDNLTLATYQIEMIEQFCQGFRPLTSIARLARLFILSNTSRFKLLDKEQQNLVIATILQNKQYKDIGYQFNLTGKKQIENAIKTAFQALLQFAD